MPQKLSTTINKISMVPNSINLSIIQEFHRHMQSSGCSERNQNNNLKAIIALDYLQILLVPILHSMIYTVVSKSLLSEYKDKEYRTRSRRKMDYDLE
jgi:hypothetical protein